MLIACVKSDDFTLQNRHITKGIMTNWIVLRGKIIMVNGISESLSQKNHPKALDKLSMGNGDIGWRYG